MILRFCATNNFFTAFFYRVYERLFRVQDVYEKVDDIDLMVGGVAEKNVRGGAVGATFGCIIGKKVDQRTAKKRV